MTSLSTSVFQILLIDDDPLIQMLLKRTLEEQGYAVIIASSGEEGLEQAKKFHPALIICDWLMDEMDGLEVCRQVKMNSELAATFFILLTSRSAVADRVQGLDTGADDFLTKPIDVSELKARVRAGLRLYQSNQELQQSSQALQHLAQDLQAQKQRLENELAEAADYVKSLLPEPLHGAVTINTRFLPSRQLGGDCFDFYWLDADHLVMYLLDVSGHGLSAALPSISVHNLLRSQSLPKASLYQPEEVLADLNRLFDMNKQNTRYLTIWYGVYNKQTRQLTYASAGHPPAVLLSKTENDGIQAQQLKLPGIPIGMFSDSEYVNGQCEVPSSSTLYIFSDGIYEIQQPDGTNWSLKGFVNLLVECGSLCINNVDEVFHHIHMLNGQQTFGDDCSLLQVKFS